MTASYAEKLDALERGTLDPRAFTHRDHIGVAYTALTQGDCFSAAARVAHGIRQMAVRAGEPEKFNATITWAFVSLIAERMATTTHDGADDFIRRNPDLARRSALAPWYSERHLRSDLARSVVLLPDLSPETRMRQPLEG